MKRSSSPSGSSSAAASDPRSRHTRFTSYLVLALLSGCEQGAAAGAVCTSTPACNAPLVCRLGRCRVECAENRDCGLGAQCFLDPNGLGACQLAQDQSCEGGCPEGLACLSDSCVRSCAAPSDCPPDGECARASGASVGVCADRRGGEDAGTPDAPLPVDAAVEAGATAPRFVSVCVGQGFACAVRGEDGAVLCWGDAGAEGSTRLGDGAFDGTSVVPRPHERCASDAPCSTRPSRVQAFRTDQSRTEPMTGATEVVCGGDHACALRNGDVWCWGGNYAAQRADLDPMPRPYAAQTPERGDHLFSGRYHVCARASATLRCWGGNTYEQLARASSVGELPAMTASSVRHVAVGAYVTCVEHTSGEVACVGWNWGAQLGRPASDTDWSSTEVTIDVEGSGGIAAGTRFACALDAAGVARCWGDLSRGALGRPGDGFDPVPAEVGSSSVYEALFTGPQGDQACGRRADGTVECWGDNEHGTVATPLALGTLVTTPRVVPALFGATHIAFGEGSACGIIDGALSCWGANTLGQLGQGTFDGDPHPVPLAVTAFDD